jgi:two-component system, chemotaxis family, chemotaxis protein CheY
MEKKRIVVVDDSTTVVKFVSFALKNKGFDVITACDGMDAMEKISSAEGDIDMVITDLNMPNVDGYTLIGTLREDAAHKDTPIIILSSEEANEDKERGLEVGATSYIVKPFRPDALLAEVNRLFNF